MKFYKKSIEIEFKVIIIDIKKIIGYTIISIEMEKKWERKVKKLVYSRLCYYW